MNFATTILVILWILIDPSSSSRIKRAKETIFNCDVEYSIRECKDNTFVIPFLRSIANTFSTSWKSQCEFDKITYEWSCEIDGKSFNSDQEIFEFEPYKVRKSGTYSVELTIHVYKGNGIESLPDVCQFKVPPEKPIAVIEGGAERTVPAKENFKVIGSKSIDINTPPDSKGDLEYKWTCNVIQGDITDFCTGKTFRVDSLTIPAAKALPNYKYEFKLSVEVEGLKDETSQIVNVITDAVELEIVCEKNCLPASQITDPASVTVLTLKCLRNCETFDRRKYEWSVLNGNFDYNTNTESGRNSKTFVIKANVLKAATEYKIKAEIKDGTPSDTTIIIKPHTPPKITSCTMNPSSGKARKTLFKAECQYTGQVSMFEIISTENNKSVVISRGSSLSKLEFMLPAKAAISVKIIDEFNLEDSRNVNVQVEQMLESGASAETIQATVDALFHDTESLIKNKQFERASQIISILSSEIKAKASSSQDLYKKTTERILDLLNQFPIKRHEDALNVAALVTKSVHDSARKSDPDLGKISSSICKTASGVVLDNIEKSYYPTADANSAKEASDILMSCAETDTQENYETLISSPIVNITTPYPLLTPPDIITESYADYIDEAEENKTKSYEDAANNFVDICQSNLQSIALTTAEGENTVTSLTDFCSVSITKDEGYDLVKQNIKDRGVEIVVSKDFEKVYKIMTVMACVWEKDPFWWNPAQQKTHTNVILLKFQKENKKEYRNFTNPVNVILNVTSKFEHESHVVEFETNKPVNDEEICVIQISARRNETFFIEFNLPEDYIFDVVLTESFKPTLKEVEDNGEIISKNQSVIYQEHDKDYDAQYYISAIPNRRMAVDNRKIIFNISVYTLSCYSWSADEKKWKLACKGASSSNTEKIECSCYHLSILSGMIYNNEIRVEKFIKHEFELTLMKSYTIFGCVATIFIIYCLLISLSRSRTKIQNLYLLGDDRRKERYIYLVMVKTGRKISSGTSSQICIKVYGTNKDSETHVLNYPDPEKRMLQTGSEDWFILTCEKFLGDIQEIEIWSDYEGRNPSWYCSEIVIYDLQTQQFWCFDIKKWLDIPPHGEICIRKHIGEEDDIRLSKMQKIRSFLTKLSTYKSNLEFTFFKKATIHLSATLTICSISLISYGIPRLRLNDAFVKPEYPGFHKEIVITALASSLISFLIHLTFITIFRNSATETVTEGKKFSYKVTICCWIFLMFNITFWAIFLLILAFWLPIITGWLWLGSTIGAFLVYFALFGIYKRILSLKKEAKRKADYIWDTIENILEIAEKQRQYLYKVFGEARLWPYLDYFHIKLDEDDIKLKQMEREFRLHLLTLIEDLIMFSFYIILLYLSVYAHKDPLTVFNKEELFSLLNGEHTRSISFEDVETIDDIYTYINQTIITATQSPVWYGRFILKDPGMTIDFNNKYLGVVRIRQKRIRKTPCNVIKRLKKLYKGKTCAPEFYKALHDNAYFGMNLNDTYDDRLGAVWNYSKVALSGYNMVLGKLGTYWGGGYVAPLGRTMYNSYVNLEYLAEHKWLGSKTRAVFIEFLTYNVNTNLFSACRVTFEISATGFIISDAEVDSARLIFVHKEDRWVELAIYLGFVIVVVIFTLKQLIRLCKMKKDFFKNIWTLIDLTILCMSYSCLVMFMHRIALVKDFLDKVETSKRNEFIQYFALFNEDLLFTIVAAFLVFVATVRFWKLIRFGANFKILEKTISYSLTVICALFFCHVCLLIGFTVCGYILFGTNSRDFNNVPQSFVTMVLLSLGLLGEFDIELLMDLQPIIGRIFYTSYMFTSMTIVNMYIAVISISYIDAKIFYSNSYEAGTIRDFIIDEFLYYKERLKIKMRRLRGGRKNYLRKITPKADEYRYASSITANALTLEAMNFIATYQLNADNMNIEDKITLMANVWIRLRKGANNEKQDVFFVTEDDERYKLIHDNKFIKMQNIGEAFLMNGELKQQSAKELSMYKRLIQQQLARIDYLENALKSANKVVANIKIR